MPLTLKHLKERTGGWYPQSQPGVNESMTQALACGVLLGDEGLGVDRDWLRPGHAAGDADEAALQICADGREGSVYSVECAVLNMSIKCVDRV